MTDKPSIATGAELTPDTWKDFVERLHHDCVGKGVENHYTADALFVVQARRINCGIDLDYTDNTLVAYDDSQWFSPKEYWDDLDEEEQEALNAKSQEEHEANFIDLDESYQWDMLSELEDHTVTGWEETWEYVNSHFTKDAAEAFIRRKKHDYRNGMRVYVESQYHAWEFNAIKQAILDGRITFTQQAEQ
jgi:hypothetical protein